MSAQTSGAVANGDGMTLGVAVTGTAGGGATDVAAGDGGEAGAARDVRFFPFAIWPSLLPHGPVRRSRLGQTVQEGVLGRLRGDDDARERSAFHRTCHLRRNHDRGHPT